LLLLAHVAELSDLPLDGLATYEDVALRFDHLNREEPEAPSLERTLVDAADLVEFGVRRSGERTVQAGLRFRDAELREAIPHALAAHGVRREFKRVLWALGERRRCGDCEREVFAVPLYRTRGLDDLRANVCPECGNIFQSYRMPKGKDMQAVLNDAFLDLGLVVEWSFQLGRASLGLQMVSAQADPLTVGALKDRLFGELFERYRLDLTREQVFLSQSGGAADPNTPAAELLETAFRISFTADARVSPAKALEQIRHRIRTRFQPDEPPTQPSVG
ncbi:MAG TPA: hypothetical protein VEY30_05840, partial [Myxococcaceae bacterium]|nr:hypothetical protein [Myxococcaceae bacterium]